MIEDYKNFEERPLVKKIEEMSEVKLGLLAIKVPSLYREIPAQKSSSHQQMSPSPLDQVVEKDDEDRIYGEQFTLVKKHRQNVKENIQ